jgi:RNA polymerase sigma factor (sigma-70 family)
VGLSGAALHEELAALHPACYGWALACCRWNRSEAEDVLHTAYLKVLDGAAAFDGRSSFRTWLFAVIRRTASEQRRRQWLADRLPGRWMIGYPEPDVAPDTERIVADGETVARLRAALLQLSTRQRELMQLVFYLETSVEDAAAILGISVGSARTHYHRGKTRLRELLSEDVK